MPPGTNASPVPRISQSDLAVYRALQGELAALQRLQKEERLRLLQLMDGGVPVEPGPLEVRLLRREQRFLTRVFLVGVFGEKGYDELRARAEPTTVRVLTIEECRDRVGGTAPPGAGSHPSPGRAASGVGPPFKP